VVWGETQILATEGTEGTEFVVWMRFPA